MIHPSKFRWEKPTEYPPPLCKCGKPCRYYGPIGGYSKACNECNAKNAKRQRIARNTKNP